MALRLISPDGTQSYDLREGVPLVVGRAPTCDLPVFDPTISRRHAELISEGEGVRLRDLGSSNGTFINGAKIDQGLLALDDLVAFGKVPFRLVSFVAAPGGTAPPASASPASATIVRQIPMRDSNAALASLGAPTTVPGGLTRISLTHVSVPSGDKNQQKLATLLPAHLDVRFVPEKQLRADTKSRYEAHAIALANGWLTVNDVRKIEGLPPLEAEA